MNELNSFDGNSSKDAFIILCLLMMRSDDDTAKQESVTLLKILKKNGFSSEDVLRVTDEIDNMKKEDAILYGARAVLTLERLSFKKKYELFAVLEELMNADSRIKESELEFFISLRVLLRGEK